MSHILQKESAGQQELPTLPDTERTSKKLSFISRSSSACTSNAPTFPLQTFPQGRINSSKLRTPSTGGSWNSYTRIALHIAQQSALLAVYLHLTLRFHTISSDTSNQIEIGLRSSDYQQPAAFRPSSWPFLAALYITSPDNTNTRILSPPSILSYCITSLSTTFHRTCSIKHIASAASFDPSLSAVSGRGNTICWHPPSSRTHCTSARPLLLRCCCSS